LYSVNSTKVLRIDEAIELVDFINGNAVSRRSLRSGWWLSRGYELPSKVARFGKISRELFTFSMELAWTMVLIVLLVGLFSKTVLFVRVEYRFNCAFEHDITFSPSLLETSFNFSKKIDISDVNAQTLKQVIELKKRSNCLIFK